MVRFWAQPYDDSRDAVKDICHPLDVAASLVKVLLIDADGVDP